MLYFTDTLLLGINPFYTKDLLIIPDNIYTLL